MNVCYWKTFLNEKQYSFLPPLEVLWNNAVCVRERESWITFWLENIHQFRFSMGHMDWWFSLDLMVNVYIYILELPPLYFLKWPGFRKNLDSFNFEAKCSLYKIVLFVCVVGEGGMFFLCKFGQSCYSWYFAHILLLPAKLWCRILTSLISKNYWIFSHFW